jgi:hypothetical protein
VGLENPESGIWLGAMCVLIFVNCFQGFRRARELLRIADAPRHEEYHCPHCHASPPMGDFWTCGRCRKKFDPFTTRLVCPHCNTQYARMACQQCGTTSELEAWSAPNVHQP